MLLEFELLVREIEGVMIVVCVVCSVRIFVGSGW